MQMRVIDQEMQGIGGQKLDMPSLCSADLWKTSERWDLMGKELFRLKDRHGADYCLGPTHEEAVTTLVAHQATLSYRQLPLLLYQVSIQSVPASVSTGCCFYMIMIYIDNRSLASSETSRSQSSVFCEGGSFT